MAVEEFLCSVSSKRGISDKHVDDDTASIDAVEMLGFSAASSIRASDFCILFVDDNLFVLFDFPPCPLVLLLASSEICSFDRLYVCIGGNGGRCGGTLAPRTTSVRLCNCLLLDL